MSDISRLPLARQAALLNRLRRALHALNKGRIRGGTFDRIAERIKEAGQ